MATILFPVILAVLARSSHPEVFCKKGALRNFIKFTGKHLCQSLFFNKVADLRLATLLKKRLWHRCFYCEFCEISKNTFFDKTPLVAASDLLSRYLSLRKKLSTFTLLHKFIIQSIRP